jgi:hypothetical protein
VESGVDVAMGEHGLDDLEGYMVLVKQVDLTSWQAHASRK